jgi:predicted  nucleic acid-binding Zn ribbon protein
MMDSMRGASTCGRGAGSRQVLEAEMSGGIMHVAQVDFVWEEDDSDPTQEAQNEEINHLVDALLSTWRSQGQVAGSEFPCIETPRSLRYWLMIPHADSLATEHDGQYVRRFRHRLAGQGIRIEIILT